MIRVYRIIKDWLFGTCASCGKTEVRRNLTFKEFCEITIPINLKERLS